MRPMSDMYMKTKIREIFLREYPDSYQILSATRGPDHDSPLCKILKPYVTARLRGIVFDVYEGVPMMDYVVTPLTEKILFELRDNLKGLEYSSFKDIHFISHLVTALDKTVKHPIWGGFGKQLANLIESVTYRKPSALRQYCTQGVGRDMDADPI